MNFSAVILPSISLQRSFPSGLMAEIRFTENRFPVASTIGVLSRGVKVVPE